MSFLRIQPAADDRQLPIALGPYELDWVRQHQTWQAAQLPGFQFPLEPEQADELALVLEQLHEVLSAATAADGQTYLVFAQLHHAGCSALLSENGSYWRPRMGLLVYPDQPPPTPWTASDLHRLPDDPRPMRPPVNNVIKLNGDRAAQEEAFRACMPCGGVLRYYCADVRSFERQAKQTVSPLLTSSAMQGFFFYLPVPSGAAVGQADDALLDEWLPEVRAIVAQEPDSGTVLLLLRGNLVEAVRLANTRLQNSAAG